MPKRYLWIEVTEDEYELPVAVADTSRQLSLMTGYAEYKVRDDYSKWQRGIIKKCRYRKVEIDDD